MTFWIKLDEIYDCMLEIFSSTKIILKSIHRKDMFCPFSNASMHTCSNIWFTWKLFWAMFAGKIPNEITFYTLCEYPIMMSQGQISNLRFNMHI